MSNLYSEVSGNKNEVIVINELDADTLSSASFDIDIKKNVYDDEIYTRDYVQNLFTNLESIFTNCKTLVDSASTYIKTVAKIDTSIEVPDVVDFDFEFVGNTPLNVTATGYQQLQSSDELSWAALSSTAATSNSYNSGSTRISNNSYSSDNFSSSGSTISSSINNGSVTEINNEEEQEVFDNFVASIYKVGLLEASTAGAIITLYATLGDENTALQVKSGTLVEVISVSASGWTKIKYDGKEYFVKSTEIRPETSAGRLIASSNMDKVPLYIQRDSEISNVEMVDKNTLIKVIDKTDDGWLKVEYNEEEYYVDESNIEIVTDSIRDVPSTRYALVDSDTTNG